MFRHLHHPGRTALAALLFCFAAGLDAHADPLRVMTFNIRFDNGGIDSTFAENGWLNRCGPRREMVPMVMQAFDPDVLGVQEALDNQVDDLVAALPDHEFYGVGRNNGIDRGEYAGIFFRASRFDLVDAGTFWLSDTPDVPGTVFPGSGSIRIASWVVLDDIAAGERIFVLNTHWDNASQSSRESSAALIRERLETLAGTLPIIVMGDLNASPSNDAFEELLGDFDPTGLQLIDGYRVVNPVIQPNEATFHGFNGGTNGSRIDYVVHSDFFTATAAAIDRTSFSCGYPSDHYPVSAVLAMPGDALGDGQTEFGTLEDPCVPDCDAGGCTATVAEPVGAPSTPSATALAMLGLALAATVLRYRGRPSAFPGADAAQPTGSSDRPRSAA